ncbi:hypothetical protein [Domibacillus indicus]|uniref:hypothetical protein n=1 Tax=Domibacillus indicus TaxID=1437523 RepID=UPI000617BBCD|nr:hypothetical protein [Domibacillus indicus]
MNLPCVHLTWQDSGEEQLSSIAGMLAEYVKQEASGQTEPIYEYVKHTIKAFLAFIQSGFQSYQQEKKLQQEKNDYLKPIIEYIRDFYYFMEGGVDIEHEALKKWVAGRVKEVSGAEVKKGNFDGAYIVNEKNRRHYGISSPYRTEKNLFYYPDEQNKKIIRKLDARQIPENIPVYWNDKESPNGIGEALLKGDMLPE